MVKQTNKQKKKKERKGKERKKERKNKNKEKKNKRKRKKKKETNGINAKSEVSIFLSGVVCNSLVLPYSSR